MNVRKAVRKIAALGTGAIMMGATIMGGAFAAADLSDFPKPLFIDENTGVFNGVLVVGEKAAAMDVQGASSVMGALQAAAVKKTVVSVGGSRDSTTVSGEGFMIERGSTHLLLNGTIYGVKSDLDDGELPTLLASGTYIADGDDSTETYDYDQEIVFGSGNNATYTFHEDSKADDYGLDDDTPYLMLYQNKDDFFFRTTIDFTTDAKSDIDSTSNDCGDSNELCDFEDTKVTFLGMEYDITKFEYSDNSTTPNVDAGDTVTIEMMGGATIHTLYEGQTATYELDGNQYEVRADVIGTGASSTLVTILSVNGEPTKELRKGQTDTVAGIEVGIKQLIENEAQEEGAGQDLVQFYLGAKKMTIVDSDPSSKTQGTNHRPAGAQEIQMESVTIEGMYGDVYMDYSSGKYVWKELSFFYLPEDEVFVTEDTPFTQPGLERFSVIDAGMSVGTEETIKISPHGDDKIQIDLPLKDGRESFDIFWKNSTEAFIEGMGVDSTEILTTVCTQTTANGAGVYAADTWFVVSDSSGDGETQIVQLTDFDDDDLQVTMESISGTSITETCPAGTGCSFEFGDTTLTVSAVDYTNEHINLSASCGVSNLIYTAEGMTIALPTLDINPATTASNYLNQSTNISITLTEEDSDDDLTAGNSITVTVDGGTDGASNPQFTVSTVTCASCDMYPSESTSGFWTMSGTDKYIAMSTFGTYIMHDQSGDTYDVEFTYPGQEARAQVWVNAADAVISSTGGADGDEIVTTTVVTIPSTASKLDTEVSSPKAQNVITVGGPCVNSVTAAWMGVTYGEAPGCLEGAPAVGKAYIKLYESGGNVGMVVSGRTAEDTKRATEVISNYANARWKDLLVGTEVEVSGTSTELDAITVSAPQ